MSAIVLSDPLTQRASLIHTHRVDTLNGELLSCLVHLDGQLHFPCFSLLQSSIDAVALRGSPHTMQPSACCTPTSNRMSDALLKQSGMRRPGQAHPRDSGRPLASPLPSTSTAYGAASVGAMIPAWWVMRNCIPGKQAPATWPRSMSAAAPAGQSVLPQSNSGPS